MIKIVRNNSGIESLKKHKYVFRTIVDGVEMYSKIGLKPIIGAILGHFKYRWLIKNEKLEGPNKDSYFIFKDLYAHFCGWKSGQKPKKSGFWTKNEVLNTLKYW